VVDLRIKEITQLIAPLRVAPGASIRLAHDFDPGYQAGFVRKRDGGALLSRGVELLREYQAKLAAQQSRGLLVVLQALDAGGKDGTIKHVMSGVNPQGVTVHSFKVPSATELGHDYLWRYACNLPGRGEIGIFNRSHYEEVLVVRVHPENLDRQRLPATARGDGIWHRRYHEINAWERYLTDNGFSVVKLLLNISKEEQLRRFMKRLDRPDKNWKFSAADIKERQYWDDYQSAFSQMLSHTSTSWAPWYVIPADHKWFARICASAVIVAALSELDPQFPKLSEAARQELAVARKALESEGGP
jgi:PPK2 family polyphosphate:nucleotide phosphotransferase